MEKIFVNFTNHPASRWEENQTQKALEYGRIVEMSFPLVDPKGDEDYIANLAEECVQQILEHQPQAVLCQGEFCLAYHVICRLKEKGIKVLAACSERCVQEQGNKKEVVFRFVQFREY